MTQDPPQEDKEGQESSGLPLSKVARPAPMPPDQVAGAKPKQEIAPEKEQAKEQAKEKISVSLETKPLSDFAPKDSTTTKTEKPIEMPVPSLASSQRRKKRPVGLGFGLVVIVFAGVVFLFERGDLLPQRVNRISSGEILRIQAPSEPIKSLPDEPGGEVVPFQNEDVLNNTNTQTYVTLRAPDEKPSQEILNPSEPIAEKEEPVAEEPETQEEVKEEIKVAAVSVESVAPSESVEPAKFAEVETEKEEVKEPVVSSATETTPEPAPEPAKEPEYDGPLWVLQVGSFRSQKDAEEFSKNYVGRHTFLRGLGDGVEQAEVSGKQHFRAYYGPWKTSDKPLQLCRRLKSAESDCLVRRLR